MAAVLSTHNLQQEKIDHDKIVWHVAGTLTCKGYRVRANHPRWAGDLPYEINGQRPDIIASKDMKTVLVEIETCDSLNDDPIEERLAGLLGENRVVVIVPAYCVHGYDVHSPALDLRAYLQKSGIYNVSIGTCDPETGTVVGSF